MWATRSQKKPAAKPALPKTPPSDGGRGGAVATKLPPCWAVAFSPDGVRLAVGTYRRVVVYEVASGNKLSDWMVASDAVRALAFSPDGAVLAAGTGVPGVSGAILLLNTTTGQVLKPLKPHYDTVESVAFLGSQILSAANDEKVCVTDSVTGQTIGTLSEHVGRCLSVAVPSRTTPQDGGALFATGGADKMFKVWDAEKRRVVVNFDQCGSVVWCAAALAQPGRFLVGSGDGALRIFGVRSDGKARDPKEPDPRTGFVGQTFGGAHPDGVYAVAVAPNGQTVASGGADKKVKVWNLGRNRMEKEFTESMSDIWGLAISPNSQLLAAASLDGRVRLYDIIQNKLVRELPPAPTATPSAPGVPQ
jgi:WD40 repeat protein